MRATAGSSSKPRFLFNLANTRFDRREYVEAIAACDRLLAAAPEFAHGYALRGFSRVALKRPGAASDLERFLALAPDDRLAAHARKLLAGADARSTR